MDPHGDKTMRTLKPQRFLALLGLFALAGCEDVGTELSFDELTAEEQLELSVLESPGSFDIPVELTAASNDVAMNRGVMGVSEARDLNAQASATFAEARQAMLAGDHRRALDLGRLARRLIARALMATDGVESIEALIERIEALALTLEDDVFDDPDALRAELEAIAAEARELLAAGQTLEAAIKAILGEQRARMRRRHDISIDRVRLEVSFAGTAVALAERLINAQDPATDVANSDRQNRWLAHAKRLLERAETALANGHFARALHFAQHAHWSALKAVILPGGITEAELKAMVELAENLLEQAKAALGDDPTELELRIFKRAGRLIEIGKARLAEGHKRGVAAVWRGAVMSAWLLD